MDKLLARDTVATAYAIERSCINKAEVRVFSCCAQGRTEGLLEGVCVSVMDVKHTRNQLLTLLH